MKTAKLAPVFLIAFLAAPAFAQTAAAETQRDANQQQRIENGLQSGQLTTHEAGKLEHEEAAVNRAEAHASQDGTLSDAEKTRIQKMQDKASHDITAEKHDAQTGNPNSASSKRMQLDVQRNANQEQRIATGVKSGALTNKEASRLERGQARVDGKEARAAADGKVNAREQRRTQRSENRQSRHIRRQKHDQQTAG